MKRRPGAKRDDRKDRKSNPHLPPRSSWRLHVCNACGHGLHFGGTCQAAVLMPRQYWIDFPSRPAPLRRCGCNRQTRF